MCSRIELLINVIIGWSLVSPVRLAANDNRVPRDVPTQINRAVAEMVESPTGLLAGRFKLLRLPSEQVVPAIVKVLRNDRVLLDEKVRTGLYVVLLEHKAAETDLGYSQLIMRLREPASRLYCAKALGLALPEKHAEVAALVHDLLVIPDAELSLKTAAVRTLGRLGKSAANSLKVIEEILRNNEFPEELRWASAYAVFQIGGADRAILLYPDVDPVGEKVIVWALTRVAGATQGTFTAEVEHRTRLRELVLNGMASNDRDVRQAALEGLVLVFGEELFVGDSTHDYAINAKVRAALQKMAERDPVSELAEKAARILGDLDLTAQKILRSRDRRRQVPGGQ